MPLRAKDSQAVLDALTRGCGICRASEPLAVGSLVGVLTARCPRHSPNMPVVGVAARQLGTFDDLSALWRAVVAEARP